MKGILGIFLEKSAESMIERALRACDYLTKPRTKAEVINLKDYRDRRMLNLMKRKGSDLI